MNLIIDIGNTCAKLACFDGCEFVEQVRIDRGETRLLTEFCGRRPFSRGIVSAVADVTDDMQRCIRSLSFPVMQLVSGVTPVPVRVRYATPSTLGTDRLAAAVEAAARCPGRHVVVIDIGTCLTFDIVNDRGEYLGGNISPGPSMRLKALHSYTARLPRVERRGVAPMIGNTTITAVRSGVLYGIKYEIEGYVAALAADRPDLCVIITGGVHLDLPLSLDCDVFTDDSIVPRGLNRILMYNEERKHDNPDNSGNTSYTPTSLQ